MSKKMRKSLVLCLALSLFMGSSLNVSAVEPTSVTQEDQNAQENKEVKENKEDEYKPGLTKDEIVYVDLDAYGKINTMNVVNGYKLNGHREITSYGPYKNIVNMTNYDKPEITGDTVKWNLEEGLSEFYFQGDVESGELPWNINVKYKLNGVESAIDQLAGAAGMVEAIVEVTPNENAKDYFKNNFLLQASVNFDMSKCLSVEAPDATVVNLGQTRTITFMAMPGEATTFHIFVGTESFEYDGLNMVMAPARMSALRDVMDLKDKKERIEDAADAASASLDIMLDSAKSLQGGIGQLRDGVGELQKGIQGVRKEGAAKDEKVEKLIEQMNSFTTSLDTINPHLATAQELVRDGYSNAQKLCDSIEKLKPEIDKVTECSQKVQKDISNIKDMLDDIQESKEGLGDKLKWLSKRLEELKGDSNELANALSLARNDLSNAETTLKYTASYIGKIEDQGIQGVTGGFLQALSYLTNHGDDVLQETRDMVYTAGDLADETRKITDMAKKMNEAISSHEDDMDLALDNLSEIIEATTGIGKVTSEIIDTTVEVKHAFDKYEEEAVSALQDMSGVITEVTELTKRGEELTTQIHQSVQNTRDGLYDGSDASFNGAIKAFNDLIASLNTTDALKENKNIVKDTIDDEWDKLDEDYNFFEIDLDAEPESFVSELNKDLSSVQFILRTPEIEIEEADDLADLEPQKEDVGLWGRIKNIFVNILSIFGF